MFYPKLHILSTESATKYEMCLKLFTKNCQVIRIWVLQETVHKYPRAYLVKVYRLLSVLFNYV